MRGARDRVSVRSEGDGVSLKLPGFDANLTVPGQKIGGGDMDLDGMALHPGTEPAGMDIDGDRDGGRVTMRFTDPAAPGGRLGALRQGGT